MSEIVICDQCGNQEYPTDFCTCERCPTCCHVLQGDVCQNCRGEDESTILELPSKLVHKALRAAMRLSGDESGLTDVERNQLAQEVKRIWTSMMKH